MNHQAPLLDIRGLRTHFSTEAGVAKAVDGVDLSIYPGEVARPGRRVGIGQERHRAERAAAHPQSAGTNRGGRDPLQGPRSAEARLTKASASVRGDEISMIFQEPMTSLNPVFTIGMQLMEVYLQHEKLSKQEAFNRSVEMLRQVGIDRRAGADEAVSASIFRRAAAADHDRDGAGTDAGPAHRRRADDGARRDDSGADSRLDARDEGCARRTRRSC